MVLLQITSPALGSARSCLALLSAAARQMLFPELRGPSAPHRQQPPVGSQEGGRLCSSPSAAWPVCAAAQRQCELSPNRRAGGEPRGEVQAEVNGG